MNKTQNTWKKNSIQQKISKKNISAKSFQFHAEHQPFNIPIVTRERKKKKKSLEKGGGFLDFAFYKMKHRKTERSSSNQQPQLRCPEVRTSKQLCRLVERGTAERFEICWQMPHPRIPHRFVRRNVTHRCVPRRNVERKTEKNRKRRSTRRRHI